MSDRTVLNPQYANSLNGLFQGSANLDVGNVLANKVTIDSSNAGSDYSLTCNSNTLLILSDASTTANVLIGNPSTNVTLSCPYNGALKVPQLEINNNNGNVATLSAISTDYLSLNGGNLQGANLNATESIACYGILTMASTQGSCGIQYTYPYVTIGSPLSVTGYISAPNYTGGIYNDAYTLQPTRAIPVSGTSAVVVLIPWYPTENWTTDTVTVVQSYISDYPINTQSVGLVKVSSGQLQITFNTYNSYGATSNLYSVNFIVMNQYT
jgi:hypothetical protein